MTMKAGREDECAAIAKDLMATTRAQDRGCISYTFFRRADDPVS
jgi:quinol monooxygenase YgiN